MDVNVNKDQDRRTDTHVYFWNGVYSQWLTKEDMIVENGLSFYSAEHYMMYHKVMLFGEVDVAKQILKSTSPRNVKALGRGIPTFTQEIWDRHKVNIVTEGSYLKFTQNPEYLRIMLDDENLNLVEASPEDKIWGIGLHFTDDRVLVEKQWQGQNLLGECLMIARELILAERDEVKGEII